MALVPFPPLCRKSTPWTVAKALCYSFPVKPMEKPSWDMLRPELFKVGTGLPGVANGVQHAPIGAATIQETLLEGLRLVEDRPD